MANTQPAAKLVYPKRLIEVDLPIGRISTHARREKSIRHGHISTLHIWWARRPLASCRAVICASLWPDPADPICPQSFRDQAAELITQFAENVYHKGPLKAGASVESFGQWDGIVTAKSKGIGFNTTDPIHLNKLRYALLDFIADFANWDNSTVTEYLETSRALTQAAHEALGGLPGTRPLVVDPFAGGGSIPLEALRVGADAFASDLNPIPVLLNKVVLEYIPKYGQRLADEVRKWGQWIKDEAEKELAEFYPKDEDGATPIAYLWARTVLSEAPGQGEIPIEVPLMRSMWLAKRAGRKKALRWLRDPKGKVKTETVDIPYCKSGQRVIKRVKRPLLEIFEPTKDSDVEGGTVARGSATCPVTGYATPVDRVRAQLKARRGGAADARLFCVVTTRKSEQGRTYRVPTKADQKAFDNASLELDRREEVFKTRAAQQERPSNRTGPNGANSRQSLIPDEVISLNELRRISIPIYGMERWADLFSPRQLLVLSTLTQLVCAVTVKTSQDVSLTPGLAEAIATILAMVIGRQADYLSSLTVWSSSGEFVAHTFGRQAIPMVWEYPECQPFTDSSGNFDGALAWVARVIEANIIQDSTQGHIEQATATKHPLPTDAANALITDPPYYDAVPYAYLSDFFYVWMRRTLVNVHPLLFHAATVPKDQEIVVDRPHALSNSTHDVVFYERELTKAFADGRRVVRPDGISVIVFASKTTASWEAILQAVIDAGWIVTGSWPIDTEREARVSAHGQARLGSSVHLVCRPRENPDGSLRMDDVGDWRDVLAELPVRIHEWMPRLAREGVVGADAIFACLGPALEVFSRYSRVEKASGDVVPLREYLEQVWAAVSREALSMIFQDADASGLEPDARLTAMWLWTLGTGGSASASASDSDDDTGGSGEDDEETTKPAKLTGVVLEFDAARKIAQGLGIHLEKSPSIVEVKGDKARLLPVTERTSYLFGKQDLHATTGKKKVKKVAVQQSLFAALDLAEQSENHPQPELTAPKLGATVLDRLHQAMILFAAGRGEALKRFLVDEGAGKDPRFWKLAQTLLSLYPPSLEERRWVDGVLARKKGLGL